MVKSMTGFGKAEVALQNKKIVVEIRSLNSKQLDLNVKLPYAYRQSEYEIRNILNKGVQRGKVDLFVTVESQSADTSAHINRAAFKEYYHQIADACNETGVDVSADNIVASVLRMPDVVSTESEAIPEDEHAALVQAVSAAVGQLDSFRTQEGAILIADLLARVAKIENYKQEVIPFEKARIETIRERIKENIAKLQINIDSNRLEQELIFYIEKLDITEEKVRLTNHCKYFREVSAEEEGVGRKLGFIAQEMGREINTLGSKANESNMQILVVKMKDELEKIKEQLLNIL